MRNQEEKHGVNAPRRIQRMKSENSAASVHRRNSLRRVMSDTRLLKNQEERQGANAPRRIQPTKSEKPAASIHRRKSMGRVMSDTRLRCDDEKAMRNQEEKHGVNAPRRIQSMKSHQPAAGLHRRNSMERNTSYVGPRSEDGQAKRKQEERQGTKSTRPFQSMKNDEPASAILRRRSMGRTMSEIGLRCEDGQAKRKQEESQGPISKKRLQPLKNASGVQKKNYIRRTMSDVGPGCEDRQAKRYEEEESQGVKPSRRLQSIKSVLSARINPRTQKNRISTTELLPFEHHLICNLWSDESRTVATALEELSTLCVIERESSLSTLEQVGSCSIIGCLRKWWYKGDVQLQGLRLLSLLANGVTDKFIEGAVRCGAFEIIMSNMENSPSDQLLQQYACGAIFTLVHTECSNPSEKFLSNLDAVPTLIRPVLSFPKNDKIQKKVRLVYSSLKRFDHLRELLGLGEPILRKHHRRSSSSHHNRLIQRDREAVEAIAM